METKTPIRKVEDVKSAALALINSGVPDDDPRVNALRETYLRMVDPVEEGGHGLNPASSLSWNEYVKHYEAANPTARKTDISPENQQAADAAMKDIGFWKSLPVAGGRFIRGMQHGVESLAGKAGMAAAKQEAGIPVGLDRSQMESVASGAPVEYAPSPLFGGKKQEGPASALFVPSKEQSAVAKGLTSLDKTLEEKRKSEAEIYRAGVQARHPVADVVGQGLASLAIPIPGSGIGATATRETALAGGGVAGGLPRAAADMAARSFAGAAKRGAAGAAVQAPANAAIAGVEYSPEGNNAQNATIAALMTGALGVVSPLARTLLYRLRNGEKLTKREIDVLAENAAPANTQPATTQQSAWQVVDQATVNRNLSQEEIDSLPEKAQQNLAVFRQFGYEPTPAEVLRDYTTMDELRSVAQAGTGESADAIRARLAQAKEAPKKFLESKIGQTDTRQTGPMAEGVLKGVKESAQERIGREYKDAADKAEAAGIKVQPDAMVEAAKDNFTDFAVGNAATSSALYHKFALQVAKDLPPETVKAIDAEIAKTPMHAQEVGPTKFMRYAEAAGGLSPTTLEFMRKELNAASPSTASDAAVVKKIKKAIRADTDTLPEDFYGKARAMAAENFDALSRVPEIGKFVKEGVPYERAHSLLWNMPQKKWDITEAWIKRHGNADQRDAWDAVKTTMKDKVYQDILDSVQSSTLNVNGEREVMSAALDRAVKKFTKDGGYDRLESLIGKSGVNELHQLNRYLQLLEVPRTGKSSVNPSGSALKILDKWSTSGSATKKAFANAVKFAVAKGTAPAVETPAAAAERLRRTQIETVAAAASRAQIEAAQESARRQEAMRGLSVRGDLLQNLFTTGAARSYGQ